MYLSIYTVLLPLPRLLPVFRDTHYVDTGIACNNIDLNSISSQIFECPSVLRASEELILTEDMAGTVFLFAVFMQSHVLSYCWQSVDWGEFTSLVSSRKYEEGN